MINQGFKLHCFIIGSDTMYIQEQNEKTGLEKETEVLKSALVLNLGLWVLPIWSGLFGPFLLHLWLWSTESELLDYGSTEIRPEISIFKTYTSFHTERIAIPH